MYFDGVYIGGMTLQQLRYLTAVADAHSFAQAAQACGVTQPTLSAMLAKLERELGAELFDRRRKPVQATELGQAVVARARRVLAEAAAIPALVQELREETAGDLRVGILPTIAPYLLPLLAPVFTARHPEVRLVVRELKTAEIAQQLSTGQLDLGIAATPHVALDDLPHDTLFSEAFYAFAKTPPAKPYLLPEDIDPDELWVLEEGHCFGDQVLALCELSRAHHAMSYASGSIDTLKRLVEAQGGVTVLPELALRTLGEGEMARVRPFAEPVPRREVGLVWREGFVRRRVAGLLRGVVREVVR